MLKLVLREECLVVLGKDPSCPLTLRLGLGFVRGEFLLMHSLASLQLRFCPAFADGAFCLLKNHCPQEGAASASYSIMLVSGLV
jgi:hypothetical protein